MFPEIDVFNLVSSQKFSKIWSNGKHPNFIDQSNYSPSADWKKLSIPAQPKKLPKWGFVEFTGLQEQDMDSSVLAEGWDGKCAAFPSPSTSNYTSFGL